MRIYIFLKLAPRNTRLNGDFLTFLGKSNNTIKVAHIKLEGTVGSRLTTHAETAAADRDRAFMGFHGSSDLLNSGRCKDFSNVDRVELSDVVDDVFISSSWDGLDKDRKRADTRECLSLREFNHLDLS